MSKPKADLSSVTLRQLETLTGHTYRTLKSKLKHLDPEDEDGNSKYYNSREALEIIYLGLPTDRGFGEDGEPGAESGKIDVRHETARNLKLKADHLQFDLDVKRGKYALIEDVRKMWNDKFVAFKSRLRQLSAQFAEDVEGIDDPTKRQQIFDLGHDEALNEMAEDGNDDRPEEADDGGFEEAPSSAEADDLTVG